MKTLFCALIIFCLCDSLYAQNSPFADSLISAISDKYKDLGQYHFEGDVSVRMRRGRQTQTAEYRLRIAQELPARYMIEIGGERARTLVVNDSLTWAYHPASGQYMKRSDPLLSSAQRIDFPDPIRSYSRLDQMMDSIQLLEADTSYGAGLDRRAAYLLEAIPKQTKQTAGQSISMMLWVDKEDLIILQERKTSYIPNTPYGPMSIRQTTAFSIRRFSEDIADSLFVFTPPDSAERVARIEALPNIPLTLYGLDAEPFALPELVSGKEESLLDYSGDVVVINFWATWCGPCRAEMDALNRINKEWKEDGLTVLAINEEETEEQISAYINEEGLDFTVLLDRLGLVSRQYKVYELPTTFIIDRQGKIQAHWVGARNEEDFRKGIGRLIK